jgi:hypothetical protein
MFFICDKKASIIVKTIFKLFEYAPLSIFNK